MTSMVPEEETTKTKATTDRISSDRTSDLEAVEASLERTGTTVDTQELRLLLRSYEHVDCVLEAHRFAAGWKGDPLRSLLPFERWLRKAAPRQTPAGRAGTSKALAGDEISRRVDQYRRTIAGGEVDGIPWLGNREVNWLCGEYETKLRDRR